MLLLLFSLVIFIGQEVVAASVKHGLPSNLSSCRFAPLYTQASLLQNPQDFLEDVFYWESNFHTNDVGYNTANGMSYDGTLIDPTTGLKTEKHPFSAASKEAQQMMMYAKAIAGNDLAKLWISPRNPSNASAAVASILSKKLKAYSNFNATFPGFGGFLPWFLANATELQPTSDWVNRVPALDNGELIWAVYAVVQALHRHREPNMQQLAKEWQAWLDYTKTTAAKVFHLGGGAICAVTDLNQTLALIDPRQNITCEGGTVTNTLNDPYEGELFAWWLYFFGGLSDADRENIWVLKRPQLRAVEYRGNTVNTSPSLRIAQNYTNLPVMNASRTITVQRGFWFSSHEQWKLLEMPYLDVSLIKRVFHNAERVRTCNSILMGQNPGMFASVNNVTDPITGEIDGYISYAGIPSVANQTLQELDVITPYSVFPTLLFNQSVGLAWYKNMLDGRGMQNPYGSSESLRRDGTGISAFVSWDSKVTTLVAMLGGVGDLVRTKMKSDGIYEEFVKRIGDEYALAFGSNGEKLQGEDVPMCLPDFEVPVVNVTDFTSCQG